MKREEQIRMLLHPERYTDEQLNQMLNEADIPTPDVEEQWQRFKTKHVNVKRRWTRVAATFISVLMLSGIAFATVQWLASPSPSIGGNVELNVSSSSSSNQALPPSEGLEEASMDSVYIFSNTPLDEMVQKLAIYYNKVADIHNDEAHDVRLYYKWKMKDNLERVVIDLNHFDRVNLAIEDDKLIVKP